jgi:hypothetical protein
VCHAAKSDPAARHTRSGGPRSLAGNRCPNRGDRCSAGTRQTKAVSGRSSRRLVSCLRRALCSASGRVGEPTPKGNALSVQFESVRILCEVVRSQDHATAHRQSAPGNNGPVDERAVMPMIERPVSGRRTWDAGSSDGQEQPDETREPHTCCLTQDPRKGWLPS